MARKRKSEATRLDEVDRTLYSTFCSAANSLSQLYTQTMNQQKLSFQAGERHALEKLYQWILRQHEEGSRLTVADILAHIQNEIDYGGEDASASPRFQFPHQHSQSTMHSTNTSNQPPSGFSAQPTAGSAFRSSHSDQSKNSVFSNALSSPVRRSLQPYHLAQGGGSYYVNGGGRSNELNRESNSPSPNDSDMHADSPPHESY
ncbi:uncharacterized protein LOC109717089 [Ananas comosus]|uniref:Uncharacterized protein LOC109717089 n=1 Tax=Ananas comosus TaxID=4615 RepID=A0A199W7I3_ANACO|nr:uncharacterized protein LOC109717089 [Ananas comosus]OAY84875.1 hypothetical protein ACMD2_15961 [Ananas comosus]